MFIELIDETEVVKEEYQKLVEDVVSFASDYLHYPENRECCISFVSSERIREINRDFRNIDKVTDVISFALDDEEEDMDPIKNFMASCIVFLHEEESSEKTNDSYSKNFQHFVILIGSLLASGVLVYFVWTQLSQVSGNFANLFIQLSDFSQTFFDSLFSKIDIATILAQLFLAIPVSLYLYGLIVGSLLSERTSTFNYQVFQEKVQPLRAIPNFAAYIVIGSLLVTYILFFTTGLSELGNLLSAGTVTEAISPQSASSIAVTGFWQLVRVSLLNFAVLGAFYLISKKPLWDQIGTRLATTLLFIFATLLTLLAGWKLFGVYIYLYGPTPLRLLSGWFVLVLLVWCLLILIRLYKPIQAIRIGILYAMISFTILCYLYPFLLK